ncbi:hypothetical protein B0T20DRAFT_411156 [Sordaria brevicollis]|uniref:Uncharacterized protein n=1 Tax=Sordaria brevicollis TaxID=83679 RepID=A0AAE0UBW6_SORBR|nr:hypothetical protein B0T20DRAFT_411156 [Sordaria brevicollis]
MPGIPCPGEGRGRGRLPQSDDLRWPKSFAFYVGTPELLEQRSSEVSSYVLTFKEQHVQQQQQDENRSESKKELVVVQGFDPDRVYSADVPDTLGVQLLASDAAADMGFITPKRYYIVFDLLPSSSGGSDGASHAHNLGSQTIQTTQTTQRQHEPPRQSKFLPTLISLVSLTLGPQTELPDLVDFHLRGERDAYPAAMKAVESPWRALLGPGYDDLVEGFTLVAAKLPDHLSPLRNGPTPLRELLMVTTEVIGIGSSWSQYNPVSGQKQYYNLYKLLASSGSRTDMDAVAAAAAGDTQKEDPGGARISFFRDWIADGSSTPGLLPHAVEAALIRGGWRHPKVRGLSTLRFPPPSEHDGDGGGGRDASGYAAAKDLLDAFREVGYLDTSAGRRQTIQELASGREILNEGYPHSPAWATANNEFSIEMIMYLLVSLNLKSVRDALSIPDRLREVLQSAARHPGNREMLEFLLGEPWGMLEETLNSVHYELKWVGGASSGSDRWVRKVVLLHETIRWGDAEMVKLLLDRGAKMLRDDGHGDKVEKKTPLMVAEELGELNQGKEKVELLLKALRERGLGRDHWDEPDELYDDDCSKPQTPVPIHASAGSELCI